VSKIILDDNFLSNDEINDIRTRFYSLPAIFSKFTTNPIEEDLLSLNNKYSNRFMYCSYVEDQNFTNNLSIEILDKFCYKHKINYKEVLRTRSNTSFFCNEKRPSVPHIDDSKNHLVLIYYINDSDGDTVLYNNKYNEKEDNEMFVEHRISPKAGRAVLFDGGMYHSFYYPNTHDMRSVININISKDEDKK
jgi:hypothetical protein